MLNLKWAESGEVCQPFTKLKAGGLTI